MKDFDENQNYKHDIQFIRVGEYTNMTQAEIKDKFGSAPEDFDCLFGRYWPSVQRLINWILNNTPYKNAGITTSDSYTYFYFVK